MKNMTMNSQSGTGNKLDEKTSNKSLAGVFHTLQLKSLSLIVESLY